MKLSPSATLFFLILLPIIVAGCRREDSSATEQTKSTAEAAAPAIDAPPEMETAPAEAAAPASAAISTPPVVAPTPGSDAVVIEERSTPIDAEPSFDAKAFAGRYVAGDSALEVTADGIFALSEGGSAVDGSWTLMPGGKMVLLDPDSKSETDRRIEIISTDTIQVVGGATLQRHAGEP